MGWMLLRLTSNTVVALHCMMCRSYRLSVGSGWWLCREPVWWLKLVFGLGSPVVTDSLFSWYFHQLMSTLHWVPPNFLLNFFNFLICMLLNPFCAVDFQVFLCHPVPDWHCLTELLLCDFLTVLTLPFKKNTSRNVEVLNSNSQTTTVSDKKWLIVCKHRLQTTMPSIFQEVKPEVKLMNIHIF